MPRAASVARVRSHAVEPESSLCVDVAHVSVLPNASTPITVAVACTYGASFPVVPLTVRLAVACVPASSESFAFSSAETPASSL